MTVDHLRGTRSWDALKHAGRFALRCGRTSKSELGCSLPAGHEGAHDFTVPKASMPPSHGRGRPATKPARC